MMNMTQVHDDMKFLNLTHTTLDQFLNLSRLSYTTAIQDEMLLTQTNIPHRMVND